MLCVSLPNTAEGLIAYFTIFNESFTKIKNSQWQKLFCNEICNES